MAVLDYRGGAVRVDYLDFGRGLSLSRQSVGGVQVLQVGGGSLSISGAQVAAGSEFVINDSGVDANTRIEGDTEPDLVFVDAGGDTVGIGGAPPTTGGATDAVLTVINDTGGAALEALALVNDDGTAATAGDIISMQFFHMDANATPARALVGAIDGEALSNTDGAVDGGLVFRAAQAGTMRELLALESTGAGQLEVTFNAGGLDVNYLWATDNGTVTFAIDGGLDAVGFGGGPTTAVGAFFSILPGAGGRDMVTSVGMGFHLRADTWEVSTASETTAVGALAFFGIPDWSGSVASHTITDAATVFIAGAPTNAGNTLFTNGPFALFVAGGATSLGGTLAVTGAATLATGSTVGNLTLANGSITDSSNAIDFGNEALSTTGTLASAAYTATAATLPITSSSSEVTAIKDLLRLTSASNTEVDGDEVIITFHMPDDGAQVQEIGRISMILSDASAATVRGEFRVQGMDGAADPPSLQELFRVGETNAGALAFGFFGSVATQVNFTNNEGTEDFTLDDSETTLNNQQVLGALINTLISHGILT